MIERKNQLERVLLSPDHANLFKNPSRWYLMYLKNKGHLNL